MNVLDAVVVIAALAAVIGGWSMGFFRRLGGWIGVGTGLGLGVVLAPGLVRSLGLGDDRAIFIFGGLFLIALATAGQAIGESIGSRIRSTMDTSGGRHLDSTGGSILGLLGVVAIAWLMFPLMAGARGWPAQLARSSELVRGISEALPAPPPQMGALERELAGGRFPRLFERVQPAPDLEPPPQVELPEEIYAQAVASVLRIEAPACGRIQSGSGFFAAPKRVVTNAHVVAGSTRTTVHDVDGNVQPATVVHFDPSLDLAVLAVDSDAAPLPIDESEPGDQGLVMGFPGGGPFDPSPFAVAQRVRAQGYDIYDKARVERDLLILSGDLEPGDSGSAVLRADGAVVGVAVAVAPDRDSVAYALDSTELRRTLAQAGASRTDTGPCR